MNDPQYADVFIDCRRGRRDFADVEDLPSLRCDNPWFGHLLGLRIKACAHRDAGQQSDDRFIRIREVIDKLGEIVLEESFFLWLQEADCVLVANAISASDTEED